jgi:pimeloyl-ACP methyl ester carboxylesterase
MFPVGLAYVATHLSGEGITSPPDLGVAVERVEFEATDGIDLTAWYVEPDNGAVVILYPGRSALDHARMLTRHGYGVLLVNRRGDGDSQGDPNLFGWGGEQDVEGAVRFLHTRAEVNPDSIGALGLSVGGEVLLQHASQFDGLSAVVSEGAGSRSIRESLELTGGLQFAELTTAPLLTSSLIALTDQTAPPNLAKLLTGLAPTPALIIYGEEGQPAEIELGQRYAEAAGASATTWEVPGAAHVRGLDTAPAEYERRVIDFFDHALIPARSRP